MCGKSCRIGRIGAQGTDGNGSRSGDQSIACPARDLGKRERLGEIVACLMGHAARSEDTDET